VAADDALRAILGTPYPSIRDTLRRVLIHDQADRDAIASQLMRDRDGRGDDWADSIDLLTLHPEERRKVVRLLSEIEAGNEVWDHPFAWPRRCWSRRFLRPASGLSPVGVSADCWPGPTP
jgi:hypothetical protein